MQVTGKLSHLERMKSSRNCNPKYRCTILDGENVTVFETATDCSYGYSISNYEGKEITVELKYKRNKLTLDNIITTYNKA